MVRRILAGRVIGNQTSQMRSEPEKEVSKEGLCNEIIIGVQNLVAEICGRINLGACPELKRLLNTPVNDDRKRSRNLCLDHGDLGGMVKILEKNFTKAPVTMMFTSLKELFEGNVHGGPTKILEWVDARISIWAEFNFFSYLTPDMLFTFCAIYRLRETEVGKRAFQEVIAAMRRGEDPYSPEGMKNGRGTDAEMVMKQIVADLVRDDATRSTFGGGEKQRKTYTRAPDVVHANVAEGRGAEEIPRDRGEWVEVGGKRLPYTATGERCSKCSSGGEPHSPPCFTSSCHKCKLYGHKIASCRQK